MGKLIALLPVIILSASAASSQAPVQRPAAPLNPPQPVLSEAVTDGRLRALFDATRDAIVGLRFDEAVRLPDAGIAAAPHQPSTNRAT